MPGLESWPLLLTTLGSLGRGLDLSEPVSHLQSGDNESTPQQVCEGYLG